MNDSKYMYLDFSLCFFVNPYSAFTTSIKLVLSSRFYDPTVPPEFAQEILQTSCYHLDEARPSERLGEKSAQIRGILDKAGGEELQAMSEGPRRR